MSGEATPNQPGNQPASQPGTSDMQLGLQELCERGSEQLRRTRYLDAIDSFEQAESLALASRDYDTLSRLYYPLQEARRQKRQLCGEGTIRLDLLATGPLDTPAGAALSPDAIAHRYPRGQLLVAGWRSMAPAVRLRQIYRERRCYAEVFLAAVFPVAVGDRHNAAVTVIFAKESDLSLLATDPPVTKKGGGGAVEGGGAQAAPTLDQLLARLPPHCVVLSPGQLPSGDHRGSPATFALTMSIWEQLHRPWLAAADAMPVSPARLEAYRRVQAIDEACELAHQNAAHTARQLNRL